MVTKKAFLLTAIGLSTLLILQSRELFSQETGQTKVDAENVEKLVDIGDISKAIEFEQEIHKELSEKGIDPKKATLAALTRESKVPEASLLSKHIKSGDLDKAIGLIESLAQQGRNSDAAILIEKLVREADLEKIQAEKVPELLKLAEQDKIPAIKESLGYNVLDLSNLDLKSAEGISKLEVTVDGEKKPVSSIKKLVLKLNNNDLEELPGEIGALGNIAWLEVKENKLKTLPDEISKLSRLKVLDLEDNKLEKLPKSMVKLNALEQLNFEDNTNDDISEIDNFLDLKEYLNKQ